MESFLFYLNGLFVSVWLSCDLIMFVSLHCYAYSQFTHLIQLLFDGVFHLFRYVFGGDGDVISQQK